MYGHQTKQDTNLVKEAAKRKSTWTFYQHEVKLLSEKYVSSLSQDL